MENLDLLNQENLDSGFIPQLIKGSKNRKEMKGLTGCKKPILMIGKKKKAYNECIANYKNEVDRAKEAQQQLASSSSAAAAAAEKAKKELEETKAELAASKDGSGSNRSRENSESDKFLGMPKAVGITVTVVGGLALIVGGIFLVKKLRK
jgi:uncharacterized membrane protein